MLVCSENVVILIYPTSSSNLDFSADEVYEYLCSKGIIVRQMHEYNLPNFLRITIGTGEANKLVISSLKELMK